MPAVPHVCPKCSYEKPCFFSEGEIVYLKEDREDELALWTGIVLKVEKRKDGKVYRVLWGSPASVKGMSAAHAARHSGSHRADELERFLVPLGAPPAETKLGGGEQETLYHRPPKP